MEPLTDDELGEILEHYFSHYVQNGYEKWEPVYDNDVYRAIADAQMQKDGGQ